MDIYASDEEKAEEIKRWWRENGLSVVAGIVLGVAVIFGGRYWLNYQDAQAEQASLLYQQLAGSLAAEQPDEALELASQLMQDYTRTPYAVFAALEMGKQAAEQGDNSAARDYLSWVIEQARLGAHSELARLRLARLELAENNHEAALMLVQTSRSEAYRSLFAEVEGDIHRARGERKQAHAAYQRALMASRSDDARQMLLQIKRDDVAAGDEA